MISACSSRHNDCHSKRDLWSTNAKEVTSPTGIRSSSSSRTIPTSLDNSINSQPNNKLLIATTFIGDNMQVRLAKVFFATVFYMAAVGAIGAWAFEYASESAGITVIVIGTIGFIPFFLWLGHQLFSWQPTVGIAIDEPAMRSHLEALEVEGQPFDLTQVDDHYVMTPRYISFSYASFLHQYHVEEAYYLKLWIKPDKKVVFFKDYLISTTSDFTPTTLSKTHKGQSGMIMTSIKTLEDDGRLRSLSNRKLHDQLIETVTGSGWKLHAKII